MIRENQKCKEMWNAAFEVVKSYFEVTDLLPDHSSKGKVFLSTHWLWKILDISMPSDHRGHGK